MSDDEAERTTAADAGETDADPPAPRAADADDASAETAVDEAAESFVALERELRGLLGRGDRLYGVATNVERVPTEAVPSGYPVRIATEEAIRLRVRPVEGSAATADSNADVYLPWPPGEDDPLAGLLALRDVEPGAFADLHGERIPLAIEDGSLVVRVPPAARRGSPLGIYGVLAVLAADLAALALLLAAGGIVTSLPVLVALAVLNVVVLPVATYLDAWHLLRTTDWEGGPPFWAALALLPGLNVLTSLAYLYTRSQAEPL